MAASIARFISLEMLDFVNRMRGCLATRRHRPFITVIRMEAIVYMPCKAFRAMEPRSRANKDASGKPFRPIVAVRGTSIRSNIVVTVRADWGGADIDTDADLRLCCRGAHGKTDSKNSCYC